MPQMERLPSEVESVADVLRQTGRNFIPYMIWLACCGLGISLLFLLPEILELVIFRRVNPWHLRAYERWTPYVLGVVWISWHFLILAYLIRSQRNGRLLIASLIALAVQLALFAISATAVSHSELRELLLF